MKLLILNAHCVSAKCMNACAFQRVGLGLTLIITVTVRLLISPGLEEIVG